MDEYLTPRQVAERKGVSVVAVYKAIKRGDLLATRLLERIAIPRAAAEAAEFGTYGNRTRVKKLRGPGRPRKVM